MITTLYAGILAILYFVMSIATIRARWTHKISVGTGPNDEIANLVGAHSNFAAYTMYFLFMVYLLEQSQLFSGQLIHIIAALFTIGRLSHFLAFRKKMIFKLRVIGMQLTLWPMLLAGVLNIYSFWKST